MSAGTASSPERARAGLLQCVCGLFAAPPDVLSAGTVPAGALAAGFAPAVLSQVLTFSALPLAGAMLAPRPALATLPLAAMLVGSGLATLPATLLRDAFGRRAAFALGASLGIAGGAAAAWAMVVAQFAPLILGAFWLGVAQGFGLFYRHEAALNGFAAGRTAGLVFASGALAGLAAPTLARLAEAAGAPYAFAGTFAMAAAIHVVALALATRIPLPAPPEAVATGPAGPAAWRSFAVATGAGALAWGAMSHLMAAVPVGLAGCGFAVPGIVAVVSWHTVAMYAPALLVPLAGGRIGARPLLGTGLVLLAGALGLSRLAAAPQALEAALVAAGAGWSLATLGAGLLLASGHPGRLRLAVHDAALFAGALTGLAAMG